MITLENTFLQLTIDPVAATWSLFGKQPDAPYLEGIKIGAEYQMPLSALLHAGQRHFHLLDLWPKARIHAPEVWNSPHGVAQRISLEVGPDANGMLFTLRFALLDEHPLMLWQIAAENCGKYSIAMKSFTLLRAGTFQRSTLRFRRAHLGPGYLTITDKPGVPESGGAIRPHPDPGTLAFFSNGWQSWSHTGAYGAEDTYRGTRLAFLTAPMWYNPDTPHPRRAGHFASDMFGVLGDRQHRTGILAGFLSQKQHFGSLLTRIDDPLSPALHLWANGDNARLDPGASITTDWAAIQFLEIDDPDPMGPYLDAVARENALIPGSSPTGRGERAGWCSWYHFFQNINAEKMYANLQAAQQAQNEIPLDLFQIDDGFEAQIGDWFEFAPGFPNGVAPLAAKIREAGLTPGLWLAPFIVHSRAKLRRRHRDWLLRNKWRLPVNAGFVWNNLNKALDLTHPDALAYACDVVRTAAHEWGYPYLKLDFLYAAALNGRYRDRTKTRAQVLRMGLEALREAVGPDVELLGCGVPLGSSVGIFDAMRIGADVAPTWLPEFAGHQAAFRRETNMPSARNALQNTLTRAAMHRRWWINDPDCLLIRPDSELTLPEVQSLATAIALSGGALLLSDDLPNLPPERLRIAQQLLPLTGQMPRVLDWLDAPMPRLLRLDLENETGIWHLLAIFNWDEKERDEAIPLERFGLDGEFFVRSFWDGITGEVRGGALPLKGIPPHGVKLLALTPSPSPRGRGELRYIGSDLHISQGLEIQTFGVSETPKVLTLELARPGHAQGQIDLYLPHPPREVSLNNLLIAWQSLPEQVYRFEVDFHNQAILEIQL